MTPANCANPVFTPDASAFSTAPEIGAYEYDAAAALILAADSLSDPTDGRAMRDALRTLSFQGASGLVKFSSSTLDRDTTSVVIALQNLIYNPHTQLMEFRPVRFFSSTGVTVVDEITWSGNTTTQPVDLTTVTPDVRRNLMPRSLTITALVLCGVTVFLAVGCIVWTVAYRDADAVRSSQPVFLALIAVGVILSNAAAIPIIQDHKDKPLVSASTTGAGYYPDLDRACTTGLWLFSLGFDIVYGSLFAKLWRVQRIFLSPRIGQGPAKRSVMLSYLGDEP